MGPSNNRPADYIPLSTTNEGHSNVLPSPPLSRTSNDSEEELRALEMSEGLGEADGPPRRSRGRSYSMSGFAFESDLLPLTASEAEPEELRSMSHEKKDINLVNGEHSSAFLKYTPS